MFEKDEDFQEKNIRKKQDRKLSKHFDIYVNGEKTKIVNFLFKDFEHFERKGKIIQLISKYNLNISERENVKIHIEHKKSEIDIVGDWCVAAYGNGIFEVSYWINESSGIEEQ
jgi:hypothetical protein